MAIGASDAEAMVRAAGLAGRSAVGGLRSAGFPRRTSGRTDRRHSVRETARIDIEEGVIDKWALTTLSGLTKASGGGGALIDVGSHLIDQLRLLVPGDLRVVSYADNARGGIETDCEARFEIASRWGRIPVRMELSRTRELRGTVRVECERATLELARGDFCRLRVLPAIREATDPLIGTRSFTLMAEWEGAGSLVGYKAFRERSPPALRDPFGRAALVLSGRSVVPVVRAIEECYAVRLALPEPWTDGGLDCTGTHADWCAGPWRIRNRQCS